VKLTNEPAVMVVEELEVVILKSAIVSVKDGLLTDPTKLASPL